jgi:hypothetical protein
MSKPGRPGKDQAPIEAFRAIPKIDASALRGRMICTGTFYTTGEWQLWFPHEGQLMPLQNEFPAEGMYFGDAAAQPHDLYLPALDLIAQHTFFADIRRPFVGICDAVYNLAASIAKLDQMTAHQKVIAGQAMHMTVMEVEYMAIQCRSIFDSIQKILKFLWLQKHSADDEYKPRRHLPENFGDMVLEKATPQTAQELVKSYSIPESLAVIYAKHASFFADLKHIRAALVPKSASSLSIFVMEEGAYIHHSMRPFSWITAWRDEEVKSNDLVPLRPALGAMIHRTLLAADELVSTLSLIVALGPRIFPNHRLYLRAHSCLVLANVLVDANDRYLAHQSAAAPR